MQVLVVDDSLFMRRIVQSVLVRGGHQVIGEASNGQEAISQYRDLKPELVMMDITMPVLNGVEALKEIISYDPNAKVLMCSAMGQIGMIEECIEYGAKGFVTKPFNAELLLKEITRIS